VIMNDIIKDMLITRLLSLTTTPTIVFFIPAVSIYIKNQEEFGFNLNSLSLFLIVYFLCYAAGLVFFFFRLNRLLIYYYLVGLFWFPYRIINQMISISSIGHTVLLLVLFLLLPCLILKFYQKQVLSKNIIYSLTILGCFLLIGNIAYLCLCLKHPSTVSTTVAELPETTEETSKEKTNRTNIQLPNIYHIVFDEFQTDMFEQTLNNDIRKQLTGFTYFPENTCIYGRTEMSAASYMTGKPFNPDESQYQYIDQVFDAKAKTLPMLLKKKGYQLSCYLPDFFKKHTNAFDSIHYHKDNVPASFLQQQQKNIITITDMIKNRTKGILSTIWMNIRKHLAVQKPVFNEKTGTLLIPQVKFIEENGQVSTWTVKMSLSQEGSDKPLFFVDKISKYGEDSQESSFMAVLQTTPALAFSLWLYAELPEFAYKLVLPDFYIKQLENQAFLPNYTPIISYLSFDNFLQKEKTKNSKGRYVYIHLILPHFPNVLQKDCSYTSDFKNTGPDEQSACATSLIVRLVQTLRETGRLSDSIIIIHSDHGSSYKIDDNTLVEISDITHTTKGWCYARSRTLLLYKPKGKGKTESDSLVVNHNATTLLDIAPTIINAVDPDLLTGFPGFPLLNDPFPLREKRYFHFYKKTNIDQGLTDRIRRYNIDVKGNIEFEKEFLLSSGFSK
jgi:Sulfatase